MIFAILILCAMAAYAVYDYKIGLPNNALSNVKILSHVDGDKFDTFDPLDSFDPNDPLSSAYVKGQFESWV